jgi:hypothetical protein
VCDLETSRIGAPYIYNVRLLRVNSLTAQRSMTIEAQNTTQITTQINTQHNSQKKLMYDLNVITD